MKRVVPRLVKRCVRSLVPVVIVAGTPEEIGDGEPRIDFSPTEDDEDDEENAICCVYADGGKYTAHVSEGCAAFRLGSPFQASYPGVCLPQ